MKLLAQMVTQFRDKHQTLPKQVVVTPAALAALAVKRSVALRCMGVPVICREIEASETVKSGPALGVSILNNQLVSFDLE